MSTKKKGKRHTYVNGMDEEGPWIYNGGVFGDDLMRMRSTSGLSSPFIPHYRQDVSVVNQCTLPPPLSFFFSTKPVSAAKISYCD